MRWEGLAVEDGLFGSGDADAYIAGMFTGPGHEEVIEDLDHAAMRTNGGRAKRGINRSLAAAAPGEFVATLRDRHEITATLSGVGSNV